jgi:AcrR family transcriptional regulator
LAQRGYQGTTIRAVATDAGIDPSMVMRYYTNKEGLFAAAADVDLHFPQASQWPRDQVGERLARHFISVWEGALHDEFITLLLRSASTNPTAAEQMRKMFQRQVVGLIRELVGDDPRMSQRAGMVSSQILGIALCRYVLELPPMTQMDPDTLVALVAPVLQHYLLGDLDAAGLAAPS